MRRAKIPIAAPKLEATIALFSFLYAAICSSVRRASSLTNWAKIRDRSSKYLSPSNSKQLSSTGVLVLEDVMLLSFSSGWKELDAGARRRVAATGGLSFPARERSAIAMPMASGCWASRSREGDACLALGFRSSPPFPFVSSLHPCPSTRRAAYEREPHLEVFICCTHDLAPAEVTSETAR